ncbi:hypothetical protein B0T17DRAFT_382023 [Bombardia bombarda]|uniref:ZZ-type domain-containing protein n=1 Tax=Bombardia bombarda TaxID=252184 RepID=A0AA39WH38_9PEZI|nr:hypothetical protein B0T17DRAFT_382023 [Bombardia bombarda]
MLNVFGNINTATVIGWNLVDSLLEEFLLATELSQKHSAHDEAEKILQRIKEMQPEFQPEQSQMSIPLSIMRRKLGPATSFFESADETFNGCIKTLTDELPDNDFSSFHVLSKILRLIPGLEYHAEVAASCKYYKFQVEASLGGNGKDQDNIQDKHDEGPQDQDAEKSQSSAKSEGLELNQDVEESQNDGQYDFGDDNTSCDICGKTITNRDAKMTWMHTCYYCTNTDFCDSCYTATESSSYTEQSIGDGRYPCLGEHKYIKVPVTGWKGVKNGKILYDDPKNGATEIELKKWLEDLKGHWKIAWENYWREEMPVS